MQNLFAFFYRYAFVFLFLILEFISIRLIVNRNEAQREIFLNSSTIISGKLFDKVDAVKKYFGLRKVNQDMALEIAKLRTEIANLQIEASAKKDSVIDTVTRQRYLLMPAQITNNSIEQNNNMITINRGSRHGVKKYSTVIEANGIIGFVTRVGSIYSSVMSILNTKSRVSVKVKRTNAIGNLVWEGGSPIIMKVEAIPKHAIVAEGDTIVTTGFSHFPMNHPVGIVTKAFVQPGENFYSINITLFNDISRASHVYVVDDLHRMDIDSLSLPQSNKQ
jgi:rod shape-determining protein MreC